MIQNLNGVNKSYAREYDQFYLMTEVKNMMSLNEFLIYKNSVEIPKIVREHAQLCHEVIIKAAEELISQIASARRMGMVVGNVCPDNLYIELTPTPIRPIHAIKGYGVDLKFDMINYKSLKSAFPLDPDIFPHDNKNIIDL